MSNLEMEDSQLEADTLPECLQEVIDVPSSLLARPPKGVMGTVAVANTYGLYAEHICIIYCLVKDEGVYVHDQLREG